MDKLRPFDYLILAVIAGVLAVGVLIVTGANKKISKTPVEAVSPIQFQVMIKGVSLTDTEIPFVKGEKSFITIRNVPYTELEITDVKYAPKKDLLEIPNPQQPFAIIDDPAQPFQYDLIVSLKDNAKITDDGAVVGGNKIKIGMPIVLEGFNYRLGGTVSNVLVPGKTQNGKGEKLPLAQAVQPGAKPVIPQAPQQENTVKANDKK